MAWRYGAVRLLPETFTAANIINVKGVLTVAFWIPHLVHLLRVLEQFLAGEFHGIEALQPIGTDWAPPRGQLHGRIANVELPTLRVDIVRILETQYQHEAHAGRG